MRERRHYFKRRALRVWRSVFCWGYWLFAVGLLVVLTWKLLHSGDFFLVFVGTVYAIALCAMVGVAAVCVLVVWAAWKAWPEIGKAIERAEPSNVEPQAIGAKLEDAPAHERIH